MVAIWYIFEHLYEGFVISECFVESSSNSFNIHKIYEGFVISECFAENVVAI